MKTQPGGPIIPPEGTSKRFLLYPVLLLFFSFIFIFWKLGANSFHNGDEAMYAQIVREMIGSGDFLHPHLKGEPWWLKPPLFFWGMVPFFYIFGEGEFQARFISAACAILAVFLLYRMGRTFFGRDTGFLAALILLTSTQFLYEHSARTAEFDSPLVLLFAGAMYLFWKSLQQPRWFYGACICVAGMGMMKNVILVVPLAVMFVFLLVTGAVLHREWQLRFLRGLLLIGVLVLPWHAEQLLHYGRPFFDRYIVHQVVGRGLTESQGYSGKLYFAGVLWRGFFPWVLIAPFAGLWAILEFRKTRRAETALLFCWAAVILFIISASANKMPWYTLPALPAVALICAFFLVSIWKVPPGDRLARIALPVGLVGAMALTVPPHFNPFARRAVKGHLPLEWTGSFEGVSEGLPLSAPWLLAVAAITASVIWYFFAGRMNQTIVVRLLTRVMILLFVSKALLVASRPLEFVESRSGTDLICELIDTKYPDRFRLVLFEEEDRNGVEFIKDYYIQSLEFPKLKYLGADLQRLQAEFHQFPQTLILMRARTYSEMEGTGPETIGENCEVLARRGDMILLGRRGAGVNRDSRELNRKNRTPRRSA